MKYLVLLLALAACGPQLPEPDFRSSSGVSYHWKDGSWDTALIEEQETWFLGQILAMDRFDSTGVMKTVSQVQVYVYAEKIPCGSLSPSGFCNGLQDYNRLHVVQRACPFNSALTHEITHWIQQSLEHQDDYNHVDTGLWAIGDGAPRPCP